MPKLSLYPIPKKRFHGGRWRVFWYWKKKQFSIPTDYTDAQKTGAIDSELRHISAALASESPAFPEKYLAMRDVETYIADRYGVAKKQPKREFDFNALYKQYKTNAKLEYSTGWYAAIAGHLDALKKFAGDFADVTPATAASFLSSILAAGNKPATRNRALNACSVFYAWLVRGEYLTANPFAGIKLLKEARGEKDIVYCTRAERDRIIAIAKDSGWPDWLAVPIAFYAGMRKEEIARMQWKDVLFDEGRIVVPVTKTKDRRVLPMAAPLRKLLEAVPENQRSGYVVAMPQDMERVFRLENLHRKIRKLNTGTGRWKDEKKNKTPAERGKAPIPEERIGWNAWRHTFGSLLAQSGVSLDKISSWMGNTPEVCRRHYAQFVPRGKHDEDIEKL